MESEHEGSSRPYIGFPLGIVLLVILLFCVSGFFTFCFHWDKIRALLRSSVHNDIQPPSPPNSSPPYKKSKQNEEESFSVIMPGDEIPKFVAMPCPCKPMRLQQIIVTVPKEPRLSQQSPQPQHHYI